MEVVVLQSRLCAGHKAVDQTLAPELVDVGPICEMELPPMKPELDACLEQGVPNGPQPLQEVRPIMELVEHEVHLVYDLILLRVCRGQQGFGALHGFKLHWDKVTADALPHLALCNINVKASSTVVLRMALKGFEARYVPC